MIVAKWALFQDYKVGLASENQLMKWFLWMNEEQIHVLNSADAEIALDKWLIHSEVKKTQRIGIAGNYSLSDRRLLKTLANIPVRGEAGCSQDQEREDGLPGLSPNCTTHIAALSRSVL
jgi:hypothetical protein